jgi:hypothetical protein
MFEAQSPATSQWRFALQGAQAPPPQSMSVSLPFWMLSLHAAAAHLPSTHELDRQSLSVLQLRDTPHFGQLVPPQSMPVSPGLSTPSVHDVA